MTAVAVHPDQSRLVDDAAEPAALDALDSEYLRRGSIPEPIEDDRNTDGGPTAHGGRQWWPSTVRAVVLTFRG